MYILQYYNYINRCRYINIINDLNIIDNTIIIKMQIKNINCIKIINITNKVNKQELTNHFLSNLLKYTLPHLIIKQENNTQTVIDKLNNRVHYSQLYYNLHLNNDEIIQNNLSLMKRHRILEREFNKYKVDSYIVGSGFYNKLIIPHNIKSLHHQNYHKLVGVNEYLKNIGCTIQFKSSKDYKSCFIIKDLFDNLKH